MTVKFYSVWYILEKINLQCPWAEFGTIRKISEKINLQCPLAEFGTIRNISGSDYNIILKTKEQYNITDERASMMLFFMTVPIALQVGDYWICKSPTVRPCNFSHLSVVYNSMNCYVNCIRIGTYYNSLRYLFVLFFYGCFSMIVNFICSIRTYSNNVNR